ncbi:uncharacterized protein G2W53_040672 [Senna tora]|uniref:Uncharacterized protein n=1 Tax=Senna tora TaxID=362788 RepID=A0A834W0P6_9FABA|nr:uncharacterized protein G2W53_040672 [Senna tora]
MNGLNLCTKGRILGRISAASEFGYGFNRIIEMRGTSLAALFISPMSSSTCTNYNTAKAKSAKWNPIQSTFFTNVQDILIP